MADSGEVAFVKTHLANIGALAVQFPDDFQQPPATSLRKLPIMPVSGVTFCLSLALNAGFLGRFTCTACQTNVIGSLFVRFGSLDLTDALRS